MIMIFKNQNSKLPELIYKCSLNLNQKQDKQKEVVFISAKCSPYTPLCF
jgi:hypothetical protein